MGSTKTHVGLESGVFPGSIGWEEPVRVLPLRAITATFRFLFFDLGLTLSPRFIPARTAAPPTALPAITATF